MKLEYLEEFLAIAQAESYGTVAEDMYISVSALSRHMTLLEEELGTELLRRGPRTVSLTKDGELLLPYARTIVAAKKEYTGRLKAERAGESQLLSIGFARSIIQYGIMDKLLRFKERNPDITVLLSEGSPSTRFQMLKNNECDFILGFKYIFYDSADVKIVPLFQDHFCVALPVSHPLSGEKVISLRQVRNEHFILNLRGGAAYKQVMEIFKDAGIEPYVLSYIESSRFILEMVENGLGIALVEKKRFEKTAPRGVRLVDLEPCVPQTMALVYKSRELSPAQQRFLDYLKAELSLDSGG